MKTIRGYGGRDEAGRQTGKKQHEWDYMGHSPDLKHLTQGSNHDR